jgi:putative transposase
MATQTDCKALPTIWRVPDDLWEILEPLLLEYDPPAPTGRQRIDQRQALNGIIYRLRTACQWNQLPKEFGDDSSIHRTFQRWVKLDLFASLWQQLCRFCEALGGVQWRWQAADAALGKARSGGDKVGKNPTDRGKNGSKRSLLVEGEGYPLAVVVAAANQHDTRLLEETLAAVIIERPPCPSGAEEHLCLDKGYDNPTGHAAVEKHKYQGHIRRIGEEKVAADGERRYPARRWVVERCLAWLSKCRGLLIRYEKKAENYLGLLQLACSLLWYRKLHTL